MIGRLTVKYGSYASMFLAKVLPTATNLLTVPIMIRYLGREAYGLFALYATLLVLSRILDLAIAAVTTREVARNSIAANSGAGEKSLALSTVISTLLIPQIAIALSTLIVAQLLAGPVALYWLHYEKLTSSEVRLAISLMGLRMAAEVIASYLQAVLVGLERLKTLSRVLITFQIVLCTVMIVTASATHSVAAVLASQAIVVALQIGLLAFSVHREVPCFLPWRVDASLLRNNIGFFGATILAHILGAIFLSLDKLVASHYLPLSDYTAYAIAGQIASMFFILVTPAYPILLPKLAKFIKSEEPERALRMVFTVQRLTVIVLAPLSVFAMSQSGWITATWLHNRDLTGLVPSYTPWLVIGTIAFALTDHVFTLQTAAGNRKTNLSVNAACCAFYGGAVLLALNLATDRTKVIVLIPALWAGAQVVSWLTQSLMTSRQLSPKSALPVPDLTFVVASLAAAGALWRIATISPSMLTSIGFSILLILLLAVASPNIRGFIASVRS